ncbi:aminoacyl-tRNA hydrolase [Candidatus Uhrbacteria bacterium]|nr:aminoacyl-tRNA hydrolase [Candidatus Uhrbacteria bacterium]
MILIIGLGNPGTQYTNTRHNVGFIVIDELSKRLKFPLRLKQTLEAEIAEGEVNEKKITLCKPQTFMNTSGRSVQKILKKFAAKPENLIVIYDDADLAFGDVRMKPGGSSAGHKGMQSIIDLFPSGINIARVRVGIGRPNPDVPLDEFVLQKWTMAEKKQLPDAIEKAVQAIYAFDKLRQ